MPSIERHKTQFEGEVIVTRSNTYIEGYIPLIRELQGLISLIDGLSSYIYYGLAPTTNERELIIGRAHLKDACINLAVSPITGAIAILFLDAIIRPAMVADYYRHTFRL